ncbi:MAG: hypothetical protein RLZZ366_922 [Pseudomonadota bacterium]|jgi:hypothetical protein
MRSFESAPESKINQMSHLNAMRNYTFNPFVDFRREKYTLGALSAQARDVDTAPRSGGGNHPLEDCGTRIVTSADVLKLFSEAKHMVDA